MTLKSTRDYYMQQRERVGWKPVVATLTVLAGRPKKAGTPLHAACLNGHTETAKVCGVYYCSADENPGTS